MMVSWPVVAPLLGGLGLPKAEGRALLTDLVVTGRIDAQEIMQSLRDLGVKISEQQAEKILKR